ncbi:MAG: diguanylate cyclase domain-containing protein [Thermodesulfobacteriota bacterium]
MFSSVLFRRIFISIGLLILGLFLIFYTVCTGLIQRTAYEAEVDAVRHSLDAAEALVRHFREDITLLRESLIQGQRQEIKNVTLVQEYFLNARFEDFQRGLFPTEEAAKQRTLSILAGQRYGNDQYFWVADYEGVLLSHPDPDLEGRNLSAVPDAEGNLILFTLIREAVERGEVYHSYRWPRTDGKTPLEKIGYARAFSQWEWVIGTGFFVDTVEKAVSNRREAMIEDLGDRLRKDQAGRLADIHVLDSRMATIAASGAAEPTRDFGDILHPFVQNPERAGTAAVAFQSGSAPEISPDRVNRPRAGEGDTLFWIRHVPEPGWYLVASVDRHELANAARTLTDRIRLIGALILGVLVLLFGLILNHYLTPVQHLSSIATEFVQKGEVAQNRYLVDKGELGVLGAALYKMAGAVENARRERKARDQEHRALFRSRERARERAFEAGKALERIEQEIQDFKRRESSLRKSEERYRAMLENIEEYFYEVDLLGNLIFFNDALYQMLGYSKEELVGKNFREFMDKDTAEKAFRTFKQAYETEKPAKGFEWQLIRKDGTRCYVEISVSLIRDEAGEVFGFRGVARDVSELIYLVYHDSLTGLYNRKAFFERLKDTLAFARRDKNEKNIFYMDLDKFKQVNDVYGHDVGDGVLVEVAARLKSTLRETDHICRLGGDEFTIILNNLTDSKPEEAAQRIIEALSQPYKIKDHIIDFITPSIGISAFPHDAEDTETLIWCADIAMFEAKRKGGEYAFYTDELGTRYSESKKILRDTYDESA